MASRFHIMVAPSGWVPALGLAGLLLMAFPAAAASPQASKGKASPTPATQQQTQTQAASTPATIPPAQQSAHPAKISFRQGSLTIEADNSSLVQILNQVARQTGMTIQGLNQDQRIYGEYGPGSVARVLAQLLDGSGYNYVILNSGPGKAPAKLLLTNAGNAASSPPPAPAMAANSPTPTASPSANPSAAEHPKTPQQIFEELRRMHPRH